MSFDDLEPPAQLEDFGFEGTSVVELALDSRRPQGTIERGT
jgi:hypothetical protein